MADLLTDGSFESGPITTDWTIVEEYTPGVPAVYSAPTVTPRTGSRAALLGSSYTTFGTPVRKSSVLEKTFSTVVGADISVSCWIRSNSGAAMDDDVRFRIEIDEGDGVWRVAVNVMGDTIDGTYQQVTGSTTAVGESCGVRITLTNVSVVSSGPHLLDLDDCGVDVVAATTNIRDALILDLESITVANGYGTTVAEVGSEPKDPKLWTPPAIYLFPDESGDADPETINNTRGTASQRFVLQMMCQSSTPVADILTLLDDVRNAVEKSGTNVLAVANPKVQYSNVVGWSSVLTSEDLRVSHAMLEAFVEVEYLYTRGAL